MIYIRPFKASDLDAFVPIDPMTKDEIKDPELAAAIEKSGLSVTGVRNGKIVGCGGVHPINEEHGEMWLRLSKDCLNHRLDTLRWLKDGLKIIEEVYPFRQLNAVIRCSFEKSIKLVEHLGFKPIQTMRRNGEDYLVYAKLVRD